MLNALFFRSHVCEVDDFFCNKWCYVSHFLIVQQLFSGVGCDAKVALEIHNLREENPEKFYNQVIATLVRMNMKCFIELVNTISLSSNQGC